MTQKIKNEIIDKIKYISGFNSFSNTDISKKAFKLKKSEIDSSFIFEKIENEYKLTIGIYVDINVRIKATIFEINSTIRDVFKKNNLQIDKIIIYVRGVK